MKQANDAIIEVGNSFIHQNFIYYMNYEMLPNSVLCHGQLFRKPLSNLNETQCVLDFKEQGLFLHSDGMLEQGAMTIKVGEYVLFNTTLTGVETIYYIFNISNNELCEIENLKIQGRVSQDKKMLYTLWVSDNKINVEYLKSSNIFLNKWQNSNPSEVDVGGSLKPYESFLYNKYLYVPALTQNGWTTYMFDLTDLGGVVELDGGIRVYMSDLESVADRITTKIYNDYMLAKNDKNEYSLLSGVKNLPCVKETIEGKYRIMQIANLIYMESESPKNPSKLIVFSGKNYKIHDTAELNLSCLASADEVHFCNNNQIILLYYKNYNGNKAYVGALAVADVTKVYDPEVEVVSEFHTN